MDPGRRKTLSPGKIEQQYGGGLWPPPFLRRAASNARNIKKDDHTFGVVILWQRVKDSNPHIQSQSLLCYPYTNPLFLLLSREHACYYTKMAQNVNRKMKKIWKEKLGRGGAPAHGSKSELVGLVVLVLSLLLLLVLSILAIGLVLTILAAGLHLVRILILHQAHLAFADCSVPGKNKIIRKFFSQMGIPRAALLCYNEPS